MCADVSLRPRFESVTTYLSWDHQRLGAMLEDVTVRVDEGQLDEALRLYRQWYEGLVRHMRIEEELLFPIFDARAGIVAGPTATMREEHREIQRAIRTMRDGLAARDAQAFGQGLRFLGSVLPGHNSKEEHVLYPTTDRLLTEDERRVLSERLQRE